MCNPTSDDRCVGLCQIIMVGGVGSRARRRAGRGGRAVLHRSTTSDRSGFSQSGSALSSVVSFRRVSVSFNLKVLRLILRTHAPCCAMDSAPRRSSLKRLQQARTQCYSGGQMTRPAALQILKYWCSVALTTSSSQGNGSLY